MLDKFCFILPIQLYNLYDKYVYKLIYLEASLYKIYLNKLGTIHLIIITIKI